MDPYFAAVQAMQEDEVGEIQEDAHGELQAATPALELECARWGVVCPSMRPGR